jgi:hypothetical protein
VTNFSRSGCDAIALYPYARSGDADVEVDWSMAELLPYMLGRLREQGWDPLEQPLIGIPQAFGPADGGQVSEASIAAQTMAYCAAGASTIVFYAWNDSFGGPKAELFNAPALRAGAARGLEGCRGIWSGSAP